MSNNKRKHECCDKCNNFTQLISKDTQSLIKMSEQLTVDMKQRDQQLQLQIDFNTFREKELLNQLNQLQIYEEFLLQQISFIVNQKK